MPDFTSHDISPFRREFIADDASEEEVAVECDVSPDGVSIYAEQRIGAHSAAVFFQPVPPRFARALAKMLADAADAAECAAKELA